MLVPETVLQARYRIVRQLGEGGMGAVYEAIDERLDATVALKETFFADERLRKQFEREARLLARMHHPALPRVSDHFSEGEGQFLVMQFITGEDLAHMLTFKQGPFPIDQVLTWADQLLDALDYLHTQDPQIIHRDIKPQNLKLTARGQMILLDFGLAKGQASAVSMVTTSASIFGYTPNYAPLEQIQGLGTDPRSDIYALGATLYHLVTGVKPPDALTRAAAMVNGQPDPLKPANEVTPSIGPQVAGVLARSLSQNRDQRYTTAAEMRAALNRTGEAATLTGRAEAATVIFQAPASTLADPKRPDPRPTAVQAGETTIVRPREGKSWLAALAIGAAAVVLIGVLFGGFYAYQHRNNATPPSPETGGPANPPAQPSATTSDNPTQPTAGTLKEEKSAAAAAAPVVGAAKKNEQAGKTVERVIIKPSTSNVPTPNNQPAPPVVADRNPVMQNTPAPPNLAFPEVDQPAPGGMRGRRRSAAGGTIRTLPDGTQVMTAPDGTRVLVMPNGAKRIVRPPNRQLRRRNYP
jgi:serine/threonine protein kinase